MRGWVGEGGSDRVGERGERKGRERVGGRGWE